MHNLFIFDDSCRYEDVPIWWRNFMDAHCKSPILLTEDELNDILNPLNARFFTTKNEDNEFGDRYLKFENEADISLFILRWS
ncbi:MAG TPA: hypothetical protein DCE78_02275 [Bacteroidetes bacterium]|nr:hypothetical protein [Bacteroidota bacterium]